MEDDVGFHNFGTILASRASAGRSSASSSGRSSSRRRPSSSRSSSGCFLAIVLDKKGLRFQRFYRSLILIPWAMPGFLSLLVWQGLLNDDFGVVNGSST